MGVLAIGTLLAAGSFWLNFGRFDFGAEFQNQANDIRRMADDSTAGGTEYETSGQGAVDLEANTKEKTAEAVEITETPAKLELTKDKVLAPEIGGLVAAPPDPAMGNNYALTGRGVVEETNRQRQINLGLGQELAENELLDRAAQAKVDDMFTGQYFEHMSPEGRDASFFINGAGYEYIAIGENLAMGNYKGDAALVQAWMDSPGHRENILKNGFTEIGAAVGCGNFEGRMIWLAVQEFGRPETACPEVDEKLSIRIDGEKAVLDDYSDRQEALMADIEMKNDVIDILEDNLSELAASSNSYSEIKEAEENLNDAVNEANAIIDDYNTSVSQAKALYGQYKDDVEDYNSQVNAYNECIDAI